MFAESIFVTFVSFVWQLQHKLITIIAFVKPITVQKIMTRLLTYDRLEKRNKTEKKTLKCNLSAQLQYIKEI